MTQQDCGCTITTTTVDGEPRQQVQLCPMHAAMQEVRAALECVYTLTAQQKTGTAREDVSRRARRRPARRAS
jgi:hypothetical protein